MAATSETMGHTENENPATDLYDAEEVKPNGTHHELSTDDLGREAEFHRRLNRKLDWRIIPWVSGIWYGCRHGPYDLPQLIELFKAACVH